MKKNVIIFTLFLISLFLFIMLMKQEKTGTSYRDNADKTENIENKDEEAVIDDIIKDDHNPVTADALDLSGQNLNKLPSYVLSRTNLEELDISNNNITGALPAEIKHLKSLKVLKASNNNMTGIPAEVGQLSKLEILDLSNNQLTGLPYELGNLINLKTLNLSGNNYAQQDLEIIKEGLPQNVEIIL